MADHDDDRVFAGSVPEVYDRCLVPLIFEPYAADLASRLARLAASEVLEVAAGTGVLTRELAARLPREVAITATDLNQPMIDRAASAGTVRPVTWRQADVMSLPFADATFDAVACQFSVMFFPDRPAAFAEIRRVLRPGGVFLFNTWDHIANNEFAEVVTDAAATVFPDDPPMFLARTPHGYFDHDQIRADVAAGGFAGTATIDTLEARSRADTCEIPAVAYCRGTPLRNEIEDRDPGRLAEVTSSAAAAIADRFGPTHVDGLVRGFVVTAHKD
jgi:SAM-dependent methyltransferase